MKQKTGISLMLALLMVVSTFTAVGAGTIGGECGPGEVDFNKTVWDGEGWDESVVTEAGETVRFNITMTYHKDPDAPSSWKLNNIEIRDELPDCLAFAGGVTVQITGSAPIDYTQEESGNCIYWNFTADKPVLYDGESLYLEFDATVLACDPGDYDNWAYFYVYETCGGYSHDGEDDASITVIECGDPGIDIEKKVWNGEEWADEVTEYICLAELFCGEGQCLEFQINVSNTGEVTLLNVVVEDLLPEFLYYGTPGNREIVWNLGNIPVGGYCEFTFTACICPAYFCENDMGQGENYANATSDQDVFDEDSVDVTVYKRLTLEKEIWDGQEQEWVNLLEGIQIGDTVKFRITVTYRGPEGSLMDCMVAGDLLSNNCLEYDETTLVKVAGVELEPGTYQYPYIIPDAGETLLICGEEVSIPELIPEESEGEQYYVILWDFRGAWDFELHNEEQVVIEFDTTVTQYCECLSTDVAFALGWACYLCDPCNYYFDWDCAQVDCSPPETTFDKLVWDPVTEEWDTEEGVGIVGEEMTFMLRFEYYGNDELTDLRFKDELPCVLEIPETLVVGANKNFNTYISEDKKTIWFNMSEDTVTDGEVVTIIFNIIVTGVTGKCCPDTYNKAWLYIFEYTGQLIGDYDDEINIKTRKNGAPYTPSIRDDAEGAAGETLTFYVTGTDPDDDDLYYFIDWGDGDEEWVGPYAHDTEMEVTHEWSSEGKYTVKVKSEDVFGKESAWENEITVEIEGNLPDDLAVCIKKGLGRGVKVTLKNNMETYIVDIDWNLEVSKRILGRSLFDDNDTIDTLEAGNSTKIGGLTKFGFGLISVKVNVTAAGMDPIIKTAKGFILGRFVFLR